MLIKASLKILNSNSTSIWNSVQWEFYLSLIIPFFPIHQFSVCHPLSFQALTKPFLATPLSTLLSFRFFLSAQSSPTTHPEILFPHPVLGSPATLLPPFQSL